MGDSRARVHLRQLAVRNKCTVDWNGMRGDDATRFCGSCKSHVHNLSAMDESDVEELLARGDDICVRYYYRPDGTIVTSACPPATRRSPSLAAAGVAGALVYSTAFVGISAAIDDGEADIAAREDGVQLAMGGLRLTAIKPLDPAERERQDVARMQRRLDRLGINSSTALAVEIPAEDSAPLAFEAPPQTPVATWPTWLWLALSLGLGGALVLVLTSWLALGIAAGGATTSLVWTRIARRRQ